jgi:poly-gamma-glutamate capsule biosynthesis protein CapA/YwtB (metallophosphatase superfamily)
MARRAAAALLLLALLSSCERSAPITRPSAPRAAKLWFLGDVHGGARLDALFEARSSLATQLAAETGFVNLEGIVVEGAGPSSEQRLVNDRTVLSTLTRAGVRLVSIANNHAYDNGPEGIARTAALVTGAGITAIGVSSEPTLRVIDGVRIAWIAWDLSRGLPSNAAASLARAAELAPARVLSLHVSAPPLYTPPPAALREAVRLAVEREVSVVVAHGTHTIAPITRERRTLIAWGLGNAVFHCDCSRETEGLLLRVELAQDGATRAQVAPLEAGLDGRALVFGGAEGASFQLLRAIGVSTQGQGELRSLL